MNHAKLVLQTFGVVFFATGLVLLVALTVAKLGRMWAEWAIT